jgi:hypothetical protein
MWLPDMGVCVQMLTQPDTQTTEHVARADKIASPPEPEKGAAIEGLSASGGGDQNAPQRKNLGETGEGKQ